jgi:c-di-GMP-binding flagellar brake protein YcgR
VEPTNAQRSQFEERQFERARDTLLVSHSVGEEFAPEFTETYDIALGGVAILTNAELTPDAPVEIHLELRGDERPRLRLRGLVRWSRYDTMIKRYRTGIAFLDIDDQTRVHLQRYIDTLKLVRDMGML